MPDVPKESVQNDQVTSKLHNTIINTRGA